MLPIHWGFMFKFQTGGGLNAVGWAQALRCALKGLTLPLPQVRLDVCGYLPAIISEGDCADQLEDEQNFIQVICSFTAIIWL